MAFRPSAGRRNAVLLLAAAGGLFGWATGAAGGAGLPSAGLVLAAGLAAVFAMVTAALDDIAALFAKARRRNGQVSCTHSQGE
ncbi:hypothetical protein GCM10027605_30200 [Micromonospora zhanjiangensis]